MKLTTSVYRYKPYAPWMIVLTALGTVFIGCFSSDIHPLLCLFGVGFLVFLAIYSALRPKSLFSPRYVDERELVFTPEELKWGTLLIPLHEVEKLEIYIYAFDSFRTASPQSGKQRMYTPEYGDKNIISFVYNGVNYEMNFYLGPFVHYDTLVRIIQSWREKGITLSARSYYGDAYIRKQVKLWGESY